MKLLRLEWRNSTTLFSLVPLGKAPQLNLSVGSWGAAGPGQPVLQLETLSPVQRATGDPVDWQQLLGEQWDDGSRW